MAINATNYDGTKDYQIAEIGDVYRPNLLVNGDFQINQRGQTSYSNKSLTPAYTLDMWYSIKATITKTASGVTVSANRGQAAHLVQKIPLRNTTKTLVAKVNGKIYSTVFTGSKATIRLDSSVGSISTQYVDSTYQQVDFIINSGKTANIEYCDLFEGGIAYPHVKEDYGVAYQRCLRFLNILKGASMAIATGYVNSGHQVISVLQFATRMENAPTVSLSGTLELTTETGGGAVIRTLSPSQITKDRCLLVMRPDFDYAQGFSVVVLTNNINTTSYITISCEPL